MTQGIASWFKRVFDALRERWRSSRNLPEGAFEPLIPMVLDDGQIKRYESELLHALRNKHVRNIAITGGYGAGKSSVIRTFFEKHKTYTPVFVSLATFSKETPGDPQPADSDLMSRIEETIVQQLLYAVPADKLPKTRLKRIVQASNARIVVRTVFFTLLIATGLRFYLPSLEPLPKFVPEGLLPQLLLVSDGWALLIAMGLVAWLLYGALKFLSLFSIDGLTLKGGKLEATHHGSVLHKHVDEIIYCFERSNIDVVVIEDLDRFGIQDVFFRLREINFTIQQSPQVRRSIHFIYAIRDELFSVGDKTKFFDLIIPIIPVVNSENSREKMMELLRAKRFEAQLIKSLDPVLIETVCYYIDEMRLIKNIVNEFDMFCSLLGSRGLQLEANKLFAMVVVRNLYPEAFADLIKRRGAIYSVFSEFNEWRIAQAQMLEAQISNLRDNLMTMEREHLGSVEELRVCVWYQLVKLIEPTDLRELTYDADVTVTLTEFVKDTVFDKIFDASRPLFMHGRNQMSFNTQKKSVDSEHLLALSSYRERALRLTWERENLNEKIEALNNKSTRIRRMPFRVAAKYEYGEVLAQKLKAIEAMTYLMREGFFDTDYNDYLGFFYEGSLTQDDKNLILSLRRGESPEVTATVNNPGKVIGKLDHETLEGGRGLIAGLVDYLCSQCIASDKAGLGNRFDGPLGTKLVGVFLSASQFMERFGEVVAVALTGPNTSVLVQAIYQADPALFRALLATSAQFQDSQPRQALLCALFSGLKDEQVIALESSGYGVLDSLLDLESVADVVPLLAEGKGAWEWLRKQPVRFYNLRDTTADDLKELVTWRCIAPQLDMLRLICTTFEVEDRRDIPVTCARLLALGLEGIHMFLWQDSQVVVEQLLSQDCVLEESAESLSLLLRVVDEDAEQVSKLLEHTDCQFEELMNAPAVAWGQLLESNRITEKAEAVWTYFLPVFKAGTADERPAVNIKGESFMFERARLVTFIERNLEVLTDTLWTVQPDFHDELQQYLLRNDVFSNDTLARLISNAALKSISVLSKALPVSRWEMLVASNFLPYSVEIHSVVKISASDHEAEYLTRRWAKARRQLPLNALPVPLVTALSKTNIASLDEAIRMWTGVSFEDINTYEDALPELARVCGLANQKAERFPSAYIPLILALSLNPELEAEARVQMLIQCLPTSTWPQASDVLKLLPGGFNALSLKARKATVLNKESNLTLVNALQARGFVGKVSVRSKHIVAHSRPSEMVGG